MGWAEIKAGPVSDGELWGFVICLEANTKASQNTVILNDEQRWMPRADSRIGIRVAARRDRVSALAARYEVHGLK